MASLPSSRAGHWSILPVSVLVCVALGLAGCGNADSPSRKAKKTDQTPKTGESKEAGKDRTKNVGKPTVDHGTQLYARHCGACHGENGNGEGLAARFLFPKPRDFRLGRFRLVSTENGVPTLSDVEAVLIRGMPGSSMPPWEHLGKSDVRLLAEHVLKLRRGGVRDILVAQAKEDDETLSEEELATTVARLTTPGKVVEVPESGQPTAEAVAHGRKLFKAKGCASCHGEKGKGDGQEKMLDSEGLPTRPRDLTLGIFKGSPDSASVYRRTWAGMPGSPMPASKKLTVKEVADLVHFVLSLSDQVTRDSVVLKRHQLSARHVKTVPESPMSKVWADLKPVKLQMTPLWWRDDFEREIQVQAVHDGKSLALRLTWLDRQADEHALRSESFPDAAAVQLYPGKDEPFLGMGAAGSPVDVWMWKAGKVAADVEDVNPNIVVDIYPITESKVDAAAYLRKGTKTASQPLVTLPARASGNQIMPGSGNAPASALGAAGPGTITFRPSISQVVASGGQWNDGRWSVVMKRSLKVGSSSAGVALEPGQRVSITFAIWDGGRQERGGQKRITIWQDLRLEP